MDELITIPGYTIKHKLGQGGMATVYLGIQEKLSREVAIKVLSPGMFKDAQYRERFLNEAHTASKLAHPNIVTIHDVGEVDGSCYIVMERLHENLTERVKFKKTSKMPPGEAFKIIKQISEALDYAHKEGFIHRDIKPDNILFRKDGTPVLVDFGIARALDSQSRLTSTGMIIGTPHYMSPEQCKGESIDGQSDFYSLGVVLYEILTGHVPYKADSSAGVLFKQVQAPIPKLPPEIEKYQSLITRMMAKLRRERVQDGKEVIRLLEKLGPDSRYETINPVQAEEWYFNGPPETRATAAHHTGDTDAVTLDSPLAATASHHAVKSKAPMIMVLICIPFILAAAYFLFFHSPSPETPKNTDAQTQDRQLPTEEVVEPAVPGTTAPTKRAPDASAGTHSQPDNPTDPAANPRPDATQNTSPGTTNDTTNDTPNDTTNPAADNTADSTADEAQRLAQYNKHYTAADEAFNNGKYHEALASILAAKEIRDSEEAAEFEAKVNKQIEYETEKAYQNAVSDVKQAIQQQTFVTARSRLKKAQTLKDTDEIAQLARQIDKAEQDKKAEDLRKQREAARKLRLKQLDDDAFQRAKSRNTIYAYEKYLEKHPNGEHVAEAKNRHDQLKSATVFENKIKDDNAYNEANTQNSIAALEDYIRNYPLGTHKTEAAERIEELKRKILSETKTKLAFQEIKFFEGPAKSPAMENRRYQTRFDKLSSRFVHTQVTFKNNLFQVANFRTPVTLIYTLEGNAFTQELKGTVVQDKASHDCVYCRGMGWSDAGKWPQGKFTVTVMVNDQQVGRGTFEIF